MYDVNLVRKPFTFEYNKRKVRININVDSSLQEIQDILIMVDWLILIVILKRFPSLRSVDFYLQFDETILDFHSKCLDDYDILPSTVIQVMESNINLTICLPTGNDKVFSISKQKKVSDLKERLSVSSFQFHSLLVFSLYCHSESLHLI